MIVMDISISQVQWQCKVEHEIFIFPAELKKGQKSELPKMVTKLEALTVVDGQEAQFVCKIKGTPRPTVTWFRQTAIIKPSDEFQVIWTFKLKNN